MGGNAVAGTVRMTKTEYEQVWKRVCELLSRYYGYVSLVKSIGEKETFGDVDLIVSKPTEIDIVTDDKLADYSLRRITRTAKGEPIKYGRDKSNRTVFLVLDEKYQIDVIESESVVAGIHLMHDFGYMGMIIGQMLSLLGIAFRQHQFVILSEGSSVPIVDYDNEDIVPTLLRLLGLSLAEYNAGFSTYKQVHAFLKKSPMFSRKWTRAAKTMLAKNGSAELQKLVNLVEADPDVPEEPILDGDVIKQLFPKSFAKFGENAIEAKRKEEVKGRFRHKFVKSWKITNNDGSAPTDVDLGKAMQLFLALPCSTNYIMSDNVDRLREAFTNFFQNGSIPCDIVD